MDVGRAPLTPVSQHGVLSVPCCAITLRLGLRLQGFPSCLSVCILKASATYIALEGIVEVAIMCSIVNVCQRGSTQTVSLERQT